MAATQDTNGITTIAPGVLHTIAEHTTLKVPGTSSLKHFPGSGFKGFYVRKPRNGIFIQVIDDVVNIDLYVILNNDINIPETSSAIQQNVSRAISELVGMQVGRINIFIEDIEFSTKLEAPNQ